jgi:hypothetical protein
LRDRAVRSVPATRISPTNLSSSRRLDGSKFEPPRRGALLLFFEPSSGHSCATTFLRFVLSDSEFVVDVCCYSSLIDQRNSSPNSLAQTPIFRARSVGQPQFGPGLRGRVRLIQAFEGGDEIWQQCCPALYPAKTSDSQKIVKEVTLHHLIRSPAKQRCGPI